MPESRVYLIGGAPGAGKTTLGRAFGAFLGAPSLTGDDILTAVRGVTTPTSHPDLHRIGTEGHLSYFTDSAVDKLRADALAQHAAVWPAIERVARKRARIAQTTVFDYWGLLPERVGVLDEPNVVSAWLHIDAAVLEARERENTAFLEGSSDPERMLRNFMARSLWWNDRIRDQAQSLDLPVLHQDGTKTPDDLITEPLDSSS